MDSRRDWLNRPDLERRIRAADGLPPDLTVVRDLVGILSKAFDVNVSLKESSGSLGWRRDEKWGNVSIEADHYWVTEWAGNDYMDIHPASAEKVAWYLCGFSSTPAEFRTALQRAEHEGMPHSQTMMPVAAFIPVETRREWVKKGREFRADARRPDGGATNGWRSLFWRLFR